MPGLLIAGYGFLGRAIENQFTAAGWNVDKLTRSGQHGSTACDLSSEQDVAGLTGEYDLVIHCAASGGGGESSYRQVYLEGARNLIARFPESRLIFTSSTSVYAQTDHAWVDETSPAEPLTRTAKILKQAENLVLDAGGVVARLSGLYGPGRCHVLKNLLAGKATLDGDGSRVMNFIHRDDVADALVRLGAADAFPAGQIYNISATPVTQFDCYAALAAHHGLPMPASVEQTAPRKRGNSSKKVSNDKMKALGWCPRYDDFLSMALAC